MYQRTSLDESNQLAERLHNTIRERTKVQRGWKKDNTPIKNGQQLYYNFIRPHMTLGGKTPAEVAGIGVEGKNRWMELLTRAKNRNEEVVYSSTEATE